MQGKYTGTIRGLGIATIALSAIWLLGCLFSAIILAITGSAFGGGMMESLSYELMYDLDYYHMPLFAEGIGSFVGWVIGILAFALGWEALTCIISLIAGILGTRNAANAAKLGGVFGWGIAGAAAAFLGGRLITMALLIIMAVLAKKTQDAANVAHWQNVAAQQGQPYGHNMYAQAAPAPGYAAAPGQPTNYQQAYAPQQPVQQAAPQQAYAPQQPVAQQVAPQQPVAVVPVATAEPASVAAAEASPATETDVEAAAEAAVEAAPTVEPIAADEPANAAPSAEPAVTREPLNEVGEDAKAYDPEAAIDNEPVAIADQGDATSQNIELEANSAEESK